MASKLVKFLTDVYPYCKNDVVRLDDAAQAQVAKIAKSRKIQQAYEDVQAAASSAVSTVEKDVVTAEGDVKDELTKLSRGDLNAKAAAAGVEAPEALPNKQAVVDALQTTTAAPSGSAPAADDTAEPASE